MDFITPYDPPWMVWSRAESKWREVILYCDGYVDEDGRQLLREPDEINMIREQYGEPSAELRQMAKNNLKMAFLEYWETI